MIFKKRTIRRCPNCGYPLKEDWNYCPNCGYYVGALKKSKEIFDEMFGDIDDLFGYFDKMFKEMFSDTFRDIERIEKDIERGPKVRHGGISIVIKSGTGTKPIVQVKTFGDYKKLEPHIKEKLGVKEEEPKLKELRPKRIPKVTEEANVKTEEKDGKIIVTVDLPDVKRKEDIEIKKLEQSIEVKAFAGDKAYFSLIPIPPNRHIAKAEFKNGKLKIVIE